MFRYLRCSSPDRSIGDIEALTNGRDLVDFFGEDAKITGDSMISLRFGSSCCIKFVAVGAKLERNADAGLDWRKVMRLKLIEITGT